MGSYVRVLGLLGLVYYLVGQTLSVCNVCQTNRAACINSTSYYLCFGDETPHTNELYHCLAGFDCTNLSAICVQKSSQRPPSCGDTSQCGLCSAHRNYLFACHSRGIFQMCYGANRPSGNYGYCPTGLVCDATSDRVCVPAKEGQALTCDLHDSLVDTKTTTTTTSTTPLPTMTAWEVCEHERQTGLYETVPVDLSCQNYIYCYYSNGVIKASEYSCPENSYFEAELQKCIFSKPDKCL